MASLQPQTQGGVFMLSYSLIFLWALDISLDNFDMGSFQELLNDRVLPQELDIYASDNDSEAARMRCEEKKKKQCQCRGEN